MGKKYSNKLTVKILLCIVAVTFCFSLFFITKSFVTVYKNRSLQKQFDETMTLKENLISENESLEQSLNKAQSDYDEALKNIKIAYLTFDDGPSNHTTKILDILDKYNVKATFFVNYKEGMDDIYKEIADRGHVIANHTFSHDYKTIYKNKQNFINDVKNLDNKIESITNKKPSKILRFPGGSNNTVNLDYNSDKNFMNDLCSTMENLGYTYFDWNIDSTDASTFRQTKRNIVTSILENTPYVNHANILMHDLDPKDTTVDALPEIIQGLKKQGFIFDSLNHNSPTVQFNSTGN